MRRLSRRSRGLTLIEMLVTAGVLAIVLAGVLGALAENQRQYVAHADVAGVQSNLRTAAAQLEKALTRAGYGIDPNYAIEPSDGTSTFSSDAVAIQYRDPAFRRDVTAATSALLTLSAAIGEPLEKGQRLLVVCNQASDFAYLRTSAAVAASATTIALDGSAAAPWNETGRITAMSCFNAGNAVLTRVERRQFFVAWMNDPGQGEQRAVLAVRRGVDLDADGTVDEAPTATDTQDAEVVALDIEQLQVSYVMNRPIATIATNFALTTGPDDDDDWIFGDTGTADAPSSASPGWTGNTPNPTPAAPPLLREFGTCNAVVDSNAAGYCGYGARRRYTGHPGNIRAVRFSLAARSAKEDLALNAEKLDLVENPMENLTATNLSAQVSSKRRRQLYRQTVALKNMFQRKMFPPPPENFAGG
ncbi:MAG: type II secretion system protein [Myxococcales bacterium]|nr:type II secretion system protein [Myxococcales bacterium]